MIYLTMLRLKRPWSGYFLWPKLKRAFSRRMRARPFLTKKSKSEWLNIWTDQAVEDFEAITNFIALDSPVYASLFAVNIFHAVERLGQFPALGRIVPGTGDPRIREILVGAYRIFYRLKPDAVELLSIYHGARLFNPERF